MTSQVDSMDIEKLIEQEAVREAKRKEYNERPDVKDKRKAYNKKRQAEIKIARAVMNDEITKEQGEAALVELRGAAVSEPTIEEDQNEGEKGE